MTFEFVPALTTFMSVVGVAFAVYMGLCAFFGLGECADCKRFFFRRERGNPTLGREAEWLYCSYCLVGKVLADEAPEMSKTEQLQELQKKWAAAGAAAQRQVDSQMQYLDGQLKRLDDLLKTLKQWP